MAALDWSQCPAVESVPDRLRGAWVFRDTRMPVSAVFENLEAGATIDEIIEQFDITREQINTVLEFAARSLEAPPFTIWRYMDLPRFVSMLATNCLWFAKAATFRDDPFEGFCGPVLHRKVQPAGQCVMQEQFVARAGQASARICENARDHLYVNSWCHQGESMAMWQIYGSLNQGIAIKSTVDQYQRAARFPPDLLRSQYDFGVVVYDDEIEASESTRLDFRDNVPQGPSLWKEVLKLGFRKRSCYWYEQEWRAALFQDPRSEIGVGITFDLKDLINAVYVGPRANDFFFDVVLSIIHKFNLEKPLERSPLLRSPQEVAATRS